MKISRLIWLCLILCLIFTPFTIRTKAFVNRENQTRYITLSSGIEELKAQFNKDEGNTRLLLVLSPG
ncbi:MAG: hypothetical protein WAQ98_17880 [Blastocatellia bacterium]